MEELVLHFALCHAGQQKLDEDEMLARQLQEQEEALARGGRATRASLRGPSKPPGSSTRQAAAKQVAASRKHAGLRSGSRLRPSAAPAGNVRTTRAASAGDALLENVLHVVYIALATACAKRAILHTMH